MENEGIILEKTTKYGIEELTNPKTGRWGIVMYPTEFFGEAERRFESLCRDYPKLEFRLYSILTTTILLKGNGNGRANYRRTNKRFNRTMESLVKNTY